MKTLNLLLLFCLTLVLFSCGDDEKDAANCANSFSQEFSDEITAITNASNVYAMDPTPANCNAFKTAYTNYINALQGWEDCAIQLNASDDWQQSIDDAMESVNQIEC